MMILEGILGKEKKNKEGIKKEYYLEAPLEFSQGIRSVCAAERVQLPVPGSGKQGRKIPSGRFCVQGETPALLLGCPGKAELPQVPWE